MTKEYNMDDINKLFNELDPMHDCRTSSVELANNILRLHYNDLQDILGPDGKPFYPHNSVKIEYYLNSFYHNYGNVCYDVTFFDTKKFKMYSLKEFIDFMKRKKYQLVSWYYLISDKRDLVLKYNLSNINCLHMIETEITIHLKVKKIVYNWS